MSVDCVSSPATDVTPDLADTAEREYALYACGTFAPGHVHDPCQHSLLIVWCCSCAGCDRDQWSCGAVLPTDSWLGYQVDYQWRALRPWLGHRFALVLYALIGIVVLTSGLIPTLWEWLGVLTVLCAVATVYGLLAVGLLH